MCSHKGKGRRTRALRHCSIELVGTMDCGQSTHTQRLGSAHRGRLRGGGRAPASRTGWSAPGTQIKLPASSLLLLLLLLLPPVSLLLLLLLLCGASNRGRVAPIHFACCARAATTSSCTADSIMARMVSAREAT